MRRIKMAILIFVALIMFTATNAQMPASAGFINYPQYGLLGNNNIRFDTSGTKKWFTSMYTGFSTGNYFFNGTSSTFIAAPLGLQLNRMLSKNVYAFAGISLVSSYMGFNHSFLYTDVSKNSPGSFFNAGYLGLNPSAQMGLMYVNDARTFSISGSISIQNSSYPLLPYHQLSTSKKTP